jgi:hypothetical protein
MVPNLHEENNQHQDFNISLRILLALIYPTCMVNFDRVPSDHSYHLVGRLIKNTFIS